jgi:hypothetical protein
MKWIWKWGLPVVLVLLIRLWAAFPAWVENYYSLGLYPMLSRIQQFLFGWLPWSMGDVLYAWAVLWLLWRIGGAFRTWRQGQATRTWWVAGLKKGLRVGLWIYIAFNLLWGLNYNRPSLAQRLQVPVSTYSTDTLQALTQVILTRVNQSYITAKNKRNELTNRTDMFAKADRFATQPFLPIPETWPRNFSIKKSMYSYLGCYLGYTGYYNPFTGEAQVNTRVPAFTQPFITCHELGHQLGYAKENEANYAGFLVAAKAPDPNFRYSAYLDMYLYAIRELSYRDTAIARRVHLQLNAGVLQDLQTLRRFHQQYKNPIEPYINRIYAQYLKANEQPSGMLSYSEVVAMLVATWKQYGPAGI